MQNIGVPPILPTCSLCGSEVRFHKGSVPLSGKLIALTGTCASGKTATAEALMQSHGFYAIDGDCVLHIVRGRLGGAKVGYNTAEVYEEIGNEIDQLLALGKDIVLSHMILQEDLPRCRSLFASKSLQYKIFVLQPDFQSALSRSKTRTCFNNITPEYWVRFFHEELQKMASLKEEDLLIFDNSSLKVDESAQRIIELYEEKS
jgi:cytidylate kinase